MSATVENSDTRWTGVSIYLLLSISITLLMFLSDGDVRAENQGISVDDLLMFTVFSLLLLGGQLGLSHILGKKINCFVKILLSSVGGVIGILVLYAMYGTVLYWTKF